jgi:sugar-specific transcriptional regulator TrmB
MKQKIENKVEKTNEKIENAKRKLMDARRELVGIDTFGIEEVKCKIDEIIQDLTFYQLHPNF